MLTFRSFPFQFTFAPAASATARTGAYALPLIVWQPGIGFPFTLAFLPSHPIFAPSALSVVAYHQRLLLCSFAKSLIIRQVC